MPHQPLSPGFPHLLRVTRTPFTVLCRGVDSRGWAAAGGGEGVGGDPVIETPFRASG